ncbi:MAG: WhiB family transcriptional regulator [Thermoanaerobaculia bacterium]
MNTPVAELLALLAVAEPGEPDWTAGLCAQSDPDAWFPEKGESTRYPKRICQDCPIRAECLAAAMRNGERYGVWGGASERERRALAERLKRPGQPEPAPVAPARREVA